MSAPSGSTPAFAAPSPSTRPRARELGLTLGVLPPGPFNAITDVPGVRVGHATLWWGEGPLVVGRGPVRTGVTVILPHCGNLFEEKVPAAAFAFNGYGKAAGLLQVQETGTIESPIAITSTLNVARVADALVSHALRHNPGVGLAAGTFNPVVGEIFDGFLSDARGRHVREEHVEQAIVSASGGPVAEGCVGIGTGAMAFGLKAGVGTASRRLSGDHGGWVVGALVVANFDGVLTLSGLPVGPRLGRLPRVLEPRGRPGRPAGEVAGDAGTGGDRDPSAGGSVWVVLATDAPLTSRNLHRLARRAVPGLGRTGFFGGNTSGDFVLAFSTAYRIRHAVETLTELPVAPVRNDAMTPLFLAAVEATEEAVVNALFKATTVEGRDRHVAEALDLDEVVRRMGPSSRRPNP